MIREIKHSTKAQPNIWGRLLFSPSFDGGVRGGLSVWAKLFLLTALLLLAGPRYASAQNSSAAPYIDSKHLYRVPMGNTGNDVVWELSDNLAQAADYNFTDTPQDWATPTINGANAEIQIKFVNASFSNGQTWYLVYSEMDTGSGTCTAKRSFEIKPVTNLFNITARGNDYGCNSYTFGGDDYQVWQNTDDLAINRTNGIKFSVDMSTDLNHVVKEWSFDVSVSATDASYVSPPSIVSTSTFKSYAISNVIGNSFKVTVSIDITHGDYLPLAADMVEFEVDVSDRIIDDVTVTIVVDKGLAISGNNYPVETDELGTGNHSQTRTIFGIPNTGKISVAQN
ncbi:MAG: hypothetical protein ACERKD_20735 [Prolixibacteraceae bacterium]